MTSATKMTKLTNKSGQSALKGTQGSRSSSPDKDMHRDTPAREREAGFDKDGEGDQGDEEALEDQMEEERLAEEQKKKLAAGESEFQHLFREGYQVPGAQPYVFEHQGELKEQRVWHAKGAEFNPTKKFGTIDDDNALLYEDVTTSYPSYMPTEHYNKYIMDKMPKKEDGGGNWFIRPHHLETLTRHPKSIKDDVLNTRYISHYNQQHGKKEEVNESQLAIEKIEAHLESLR